MKDKCFLLRRPQINLCYIYLPKDEEHKQWAKRFVFSIWHHATTIPYRFTVICNGPQFDGHDVFRPLGQYDVFHHDDSGWDIGGYLAFSKVCREEIIYCMGGTAYVKNDLWMDRMIEAWMKHGPGLYGTLATYEIRPHLNTTGFITSPELLANYPLNVTSKRDRYEFEHGYQSFWMMVSRMGLPAYLVTKCGEYSWPDWRLPANIYRRGDQSNCLTAFRHTDNYDAANPETKRRMEMLADTITDSRFSNPRGSTLPLSLLGSTVPQGVLGV